VGLPYVGTYFKPSDSEVVTLRVQQEQVPSWPKAELPADYWTRPISSEFREWSVISGNWLMGLSNYWPAKRVYNPYTKAPRTPHIVWAKELAFGGIIGGATDEDYYTGLTYESKFSPPIILQGRLYYNLYPPTPPLPGFACVDLRTGETLWVQNGTGPGPVTVSLTGYGQIQLRFAQGYPRLTMGQVYAPDTPNQHGGIPYLWAIGGFGATNRWDVYDAVTGAYLYSLNNTLTATTAYGPSGEILGYVLDPAGKWLAMWNSSRVKGLWGGTAGSEVWQWRPPFGEILNWQSGIQWNATLPGVTGPGGLGIQAIDPDSNIIIAAGSTSPAIGFDNKVWLVAYDAVSGRQLWSKALTTPFTATLFGPPYGANIVAGEGVVAMYEKETMRWRIFDINNGNELFYTDPRPGSDFGFYVEGGNIAYGNLYSAGYDGLICAWDLKTGKLKWTYSAGSSGIETVYGTWPLVTSVIADGVIYAYTAEHSPNSPLYHGAKIHAVDAYTGKGIWNISGWWGHNHYSYGGPAIADGYLVAPNFYDGRIYCFGKGPTSIEVSASPKVAGKGSSVLIEGLVADVSAGAKRLVEEGRFSVVPAVADEDMGAWMEYVYMQKPCPVTVRGVSVTLEAIGPDGRTVQIGSVMTDANGVFKKLWAPPGEGEYTVIATFKGSESYWPSYAETAVGVSAASGVSGIPAVDLLLILAVVIIIILIVLAYAVLRKKTS